MSHEGIGKHNPRDFMRARGSMTYMQFIRLVQNLWAEGHPDIPIFPTAGDQPAKYPCIVYGLELRQTHSNEPKMRLRELVFDEDDKAYKISAQRFNNVVSFTVITETDPVLAEEIVEAFEVFMGEMTPVFKELGVSEFAYSRRYADSEQSRPGEGVVRRKVAYLVVLERVTALKKDTLEEIIVRARIARDTVINTEPRYSTVDGQPPPFYITEEDLTEEPNPVITAPYTAFQIYDRVYIAPYYGQLLPPGLQPGFYVINNIIGTAHSPNVKYELATTDLVVISDFGGLPAATPSENEYNGVYFGRIIYVAPTTVTTELLEN